MEGKDDRTRLSMSIFRYYSYVGYHLLSSRKQTNKQTNKQKKRRFVFHRNDQTSAEMSEFSIADSFHPDLELCLS